MLGNELHRCALEDECALNVRGRSLSRIERPGSQQNSVEGSRNFKRCCFTMYFGSIESSKNLPLILKNVAAVKRLSDPA